MGNLLTHRASIWNCLQLDFKFYSFYIHWLMVRISLCSPYHLGNTHHAKRHFDPTTWVVAANNQFATCYDMIRYAILTCNQKLIRVSLIYCTEPTTKSGKTEKLQSKKTGMLRSIGKRSGESMESVLKKKSKATVGRI